MPSVPFSMPLLPKTLYPIFRIQPLLFHIVHPLTSQMTPHFPNPRGFFAVPPPLFRAPLLPELGAQTPFVPAIPRGFDPVTARGPEAPVVSLIALPYLNLISATTNKAESQKHKSKEKEKCGSLPPNTISPSSTSIRNAIPNTSSCACDAVANAVYSAACCVTHAGDPPLNFFADPVIV
jgi:hypothetical protein